MIYAGHVRTIPIQELKRLAGNQISEEKYKKIAQSYKNRHGNKASQYNKVNTDPITGKSEYGYDEYLVDIMDFEFLSVDTIHFEEKKVDTVMWGSIIKVLTTSKSKALCTKESLIL